MSDLWNEYTARTREAPKGEPTRTRDREVSRASDTIEEDNTPVSKSVLLLLRAFDQPTQREEEYVVNRRRMLSAARETKRRLNKFDRVTTERNK
ncbi:hypothetical protein Pmar_PMAR029318 [Perkinsus marinus ATCC 50983]|uniref:Uncharacterized protein n=1 Tax=Perkinsus marinus (strain ATCC 50983 / TXsc) TaxID=423536 RepID=C5KMU1_PERM5|nr:hypothetical protein Pmar_PMAR029318 [Perkinsus marinus ATCC 50983]EER14249.1 hypothetical protein Pmar_PMAR029318 [Perkinsus marinus ATCC 50983]|eukprot:XP_002782454.1 hypothetical protein Pmar_PMAR029318 [Perkinsus marinus ATCC 50983]